MNILGETTVFYHTPEGTGIFWACGQGYQEKSNRLGREIDPDFLSLHTANNFPQKDSKHLLFMF